MIKGVIFDIDGVLLDSLVIWNDLGARYLKSIGVEPEESLGDTLFSMSMEQGAEYLNDHYGLNKSTLEVRNSLSGMLERFYFDEVLPKPGAKEVLEFMKDCGMKMTAATSSPRLHVEKALERNGMLKYLEKIFTSSEVGSSKHSPDIYNIAARYMGTRPGETLVLEDSLYALKTAKEAGFATAGIADPSGEPNQKEVRSLADIYIEDLNDLPAVYRGHHFISL